jgi:quercetin dioxygenase-like cupin family protein
MTPESFADDLRKQGFAELLTVEREANIVLDEHSHPFESKALILEGEIAIATDGQEILFKAGDVFHLQPHQPHAERYGPQGVRYLVGRRSE